MTVTSYFTEEQIGLLLKPIHAKRVLARDGMSYVEGYDIRAELTRVFGFGRWTSEVLEQTQICETEVITKTYTDKYGKEKGGKPAWYVVYRSRVRLTVFAPDGTLVTFHDGSHVGESTHPVRGEAHGNALTNSETYALRRAAINLGDQFGLSLYNKGSLDPVVRWTLVRPEAGAPEADTDDVPQVSAENAGSSSAGGDGTPDAGAVFDDAGPAEVPAAPRDVSEPEMADEARMTVIPPAVPIDQQWLADALEAATYVQDEEAAGNLWRDSAAKVHAREITPADAQQIQELLNARVADLHKYKQALARLDPDDGWTQTVRELASKDDVPGMLSELEQTRMAAGKRQDIRKAILAKFPNAEVKAAA